MSRIDFNSTRIDASKSGSCKRSAIICWRRCNSATSRKGCRIHVRSFRAPIDVSVRSRTERRLASRASRDSTKAVERLDLEMFAQCEACLFQQKRVAVVFEGVIEFADLRLLFRANQQFSGRNPRELVQQRFSILRLG